jgi:predicted aconitase
MRLGEDERRLLEGNGGATLQKIMRTVVRYGEAVGAERLVDIEAAAHSSAHLAIPALGFPLSMLEEITAAGLCTKWPFTLDPGAPLDFENLFVTPDEQDAFRKLFRDQERYGRLMLQLGLRDCEAYTCTPYLPEVGNIPKRGAVLAWSESSCVVWANSILAARTNRNAAIVDLMCNLVGKAPLFGLLTDEGRRARWLIQVQTSRLPDPQLLGGAIGLAVMEDVPLIAGLDRFLDPGLSPRNLDYLKEMGAACAAIGAVGLYHVENVTPEAVEQKRSLLEAGYRTQVLDDAGLDALIASFPDLWARNASPSRCLIGCPHLSLRELHWWSDAILERLRAHGRGRVAVSTVLFAAPQVIRRFDPDGRLRERLLRAGVGVSASCAESFMDNQLVAQTAVITNSNKLRAFTTARMMRNGELLETVAGGAREKDAI